MHEINKKQAGFIPREVALLSFKGKGKGKVCMRAKCRIRPALISGFCGMKRLGVFLLLLDGMPVHRRVTPSIKFAAAYLYTWVERGTVRVKCLAEEHNTMSPARARTGPLNPKRSICPFSAKFARVLIICILLYGSHKFTIFWENNKAIPKQLFSRATVLPTCLPKPKLKPFIVTLTVS